MRKIKCSNQNSTEAQNFFDGDSFLMNLCHPVMKNLCVLGIFISATTVLLATDSDVSLQDGNLLKNGRFEFGVTGWNYYGGKVPCKHETISPGQEGEKCLYLQSDTPGYHGGIYQNIQLEGNRRYKLSTWIKADISDGKINLLYYSGNITLANSGKETKKGWGGSIGEKTKSFDWQYIEKIIETPETAKEFTATIYPVLLYDDADVWIDDIQLIDLGPAKLGEEVFSLSFDNPKAWVLTAHVNEEPAGLPDDAKLQVADKLKCDGKPCLGLTYVFPSLKHDAIMLTSDVSIPEGTQVGLYVYGDGSGHELFWVLYDKSQEAHYLPIGPVYWKGWKTVYASMANLLKGPPTTYDVSCNHWGGNKNQKLDMPITKITIGINDKPDKFQGKGEIKLGWLKLYK